MFANKSTDKMKSVGAVSTLSVLLEMCGMNAALPMKIRKRGVR